MKKNWVSLAILAIVISLFSCKSSSSFDKDVRKMANYQCEKQKLEAKDQTDEKVQNDLAKLEKEIDDYTAKMKEKYKEKEDDKEMDAKADKIMDEVMEKCK